MSKRRSVRAVFVWLDLGIDIALQAVVCGASLVLSLALGALVVGRYFLNVSVPSALEISLLAAMWLYMCGAVLASRRREHLAVDFLATSLRNPNLKAVHEIVLAILTVLIGCIFTYWVWQMLTWGMKRPQTIVGLNLPLWMAQAPLALAAVGAVGYGLRDIYRALTSLRHINPSQGENI